MATLRKQPPCAMAHANPNILRAIEENPYFVGREAPTVPLGKGKGPATKWADRYRTTREWLFDDAHARRHTSSNGLALVTGAVSGVLVLDEDQPGAVARLFAAAGVPIPATAVSRTGSGKLHYYFAYNPAVRTSCGRPPGIDVRSDRAVIVLPGSLHPDTRQAYRWITPPECVAPAELPAAVVSALAAPAAPEAEAAHVERVSGARSGQGPFHALSLPGIVAEGTRRDTLLSLAGSLRARGISLEDALARVERENAARCQPPLGQAEVVRTVRDVYARYPAGTCNSQLDALPPDRERAFLDSRTGELTGQVLAVLRLWQARAEHIRYSHKTMARELVRRGLAQPKRHQLQYCLQTLEAVGLILRPKAREMEVTAFRQRFYVIRVRPAALDASARYDLTLRAEAPPRPATSATPSIGERGSTLGQTLPPEPGRATLEPATASGATDVA